MEKQKCGEKKGNSKRSQAYSLICKAWWRCWHPASSVKEFIRAEKWKVLDYPSQSPDLNLIKHEFPSEEENKERNSPKQATIGVGCMKGWESIQRMRARVWWCLCVTDSLLWLCARDLQLNNSFSSFISALCSTVPILMLTSDSGMNSISAVLFIW